MLLIMRRAMPLTISKSDDSPRMLAPSREERLAVARADQLEVEPRRLTKLRQAAETIHGALERIGISARQVDSLQPVSCRWRSSPIRAASRWR